MGGVYGASFVRVSSDRELAFRETCRLLHESNARRLAESPTSIPVEHTVRASRHSDWISIENAVHDVELQTLSQVLHATAVTLYAVDEKSLRFAYSRFEDGRCVRMLNYGPAHERTANAAAEPTRREWTKVEGHPEAWETTLFSPQLMQLYRDYAPDEVGAVSGVPAVKLGFSIPWAHDLNVLATIAEELRLPWKPIGNHFAEATHTEVIRGSPERRKAFLRKYRRPWWKFWTRRESA